MCDQGNGFNFHPGIYELRCPITFCRFAKDEENLKSVYYYNAKIIVGGIDERLGNNLIYVILSKCEDYAPLYINYMEEVATFIRNGIIPMLFLPSMLKMIKDEDIKWYVDMPIIQQEHARTYSEVKLKWNKAEKLYEDGEFFETNIKVIP